MHSYTPMHSCTPMHSYTKQGKWPCAAGTYTKVAGNIPVCEPCPHGFYKASKSETKFEIDKCDAYPLCQPGQWTVTKGTKTTKPQCWACSPGRFRASGSPANEVESEPSVCTEHQTCSAGQWTASVGNSTADTQCLTCNNGRFREAESATSTETDECKRSDGALASTRGKVNTVTTAVQSIPLTHTV